MYYYTFNIDVIKLIKCNLIYIGKIYRVFMKHETENEMVSKKSYLD